MIIDYETKFSIGEEVYAIHLDDRYNDFYSNDRIWRVWYNKYKDRGSEGKPHVIDSIILSIKQDDIRTIYYIDEIDFYENHIFSTYEEAKAEVERLNKERGYI